MKMFKFMMLAALITLTSAFGACSSMGTQSDTQKVEAACVSATSAIQALTVANEQGKLSASAKASVSQAVSVVTPICTAPEPPTMDSLKMSAFDSAVAVLKLRLSEL